MADEIKKHTYPHTSLGLEYEILVAAYFALELYKSEEIEDFQLKRDAADFNYFDDLVVNIQMKNGQKYYFAFQLKLSNRNFRKRHFDIEKYRQSFNNLKEEIKNDYNCVLYTNSEVVVDENFTMVNDDYWKELDFFDVNKNSLNIYKCKKKENIADVDKSNYEEFLLKFWIFTCQDFKELENKISNTLEHEDVILRFMDQFRKWHNHTIIDKRTLGFHLTDIYLSVLSPYVTTLSSTESDNDYLQLIENALCKFDVAIINDSKANFLEATKYCIQYVLYTRTNKQLKHYMDFYKIQTDDLKKAMEECLLLLAQKYGFIRKRHELNSNTKQKILQYFFHNLLIVDCNHESENLIIKMLEFYQLNKNNINFVLVGKEFDRKLLPHLKFFENLNDLQKEDVTIYHKIIAKAEMFLRGGKHSLNTFLNLDTEIGEKTGLKELLQMTKDTYVYAIGEKFANPKNISSNATSTFLDLEETLDHLCEDLIIIVCLKREQIEDLAQRKKLKTADLGDYLSQIRSKNKSDESQLLLTDNEECIQTVSNEIYDANKDRNVHFFKMVNGSLLLLVSSKKQVLNESNLQHTRPHMGLGVEYEILVAAYFALELYKSEEIEDFQLQTNAANFNYFDDIVVNIQMKNGQKYYFAFQLRLSTRNFRRNRFDIERYGQSFNNLNEEIKNAYNCVLYTNAEVVVHKNFTMVNNDDHSKKLDFFDVNSNFLNIYKCKTNENIADDDKSYSEKFLSKFWIFTRQDFKKLENKISKTLEHEGVILRFMNQFRKWHMRGFIHTIINKNTIGVHLTDIYLSVLSPYVTTLSNTESDNNYLQLIENALCKFDVAIIDDSKANFLDATKYCIQYLLYARTNKQLKHYIDLYKIQTDDSKKAMEKCLLLLAKRHGFIRERSDLDNNTKQKILQYFFLNFLIVDCNHKSENLIIKMLEFYQLNKNNINFVLVGKHFDRKRLPHLKFFKNLNDMHREDVTIYDEIIAKAEMSLRGEKHSLNTFLNLHSEIGEITGLQELLQMTKDTYAIGEKFPTPNNIPRKVTTTLLDLEATLDYLCKTKVLIIIICPNKRDQIEDLAQRKLKTADLDDYLSQIRSKNKTHESQLLLTDNEDCILKTFNEIYDVNKDRNVHFFKLVNGGLLLLISSKKQVLHEIKMRKFHLPQEKVHESFKGPVNIICAKSGSGKTTLLKYLHNTSSLQCWPIFTSLSDQHFYRKKCKIDQIINHLLKVDEEDDLYMRKIKQMFAAKKKLILFLDGLDEVSNNYINVVLSLLKEMSSMGLQIWISSRKFLQIRIEDQFNAFIIDIEDLTASQQRQYFRNTLRTEIEQLSSDTDTFGNPLNLSIATHVMADQTITDRNAVLIKTYKRLLEVKFENFNEESTDSPLEDVYEKYEVAACQTLFDVETFAKLNLDKRRNLRFLKVIKKTGDPLQIIVDINNENKAIFVHSSFAEFFAGQFLANNFDKIVLIKEELFRENYQNVLRMLNLILAENAPIHLALLCKDFDSLKHLEDYKGQTYDNAKRNPLHIVSSIVTRQPNLKYTSSDSNYVIEGYAFIDQLQNETAEIKNIIKVLLEKFDPFEKDALFGWNSLDYSLAFGSLYVFNEIFERHPHIDCCSLLTNYYNDPTIVYYSSCCGYFKLLSVILAKQNQDNRLIKMVDIDENSLLHLAAENGNTASTTYLSNKINTDLQNMVGHLVKNGANVKRKNKNGDTALHYAAQKRHFDMVRFLIDNGTDVNIRNTSDETALHCTLDGKKRRKDWGDYPKIHNNYVKEKILQIIKLLVSEGADVNAQNKSRETPLYCAIRVGLLEAAHFLIKNGADFKKLEASRGETKLLRNAVEERDFEMVKLLVNWGIQIEDERDHSGWTPLYCAVANGDYNITRYLIEHGADVKQHRVSNPLNRAAWRGDLKMVMLLVTKGAAVNGEDIHGETPLNKAVKVGHVDVARYLIENGAELRNCKSDTLLHYAVTQKNFEMVKLLLQKGADVNAKNEHGEAPLFYAVRDGSLDRVQYLLEFGAEVNTRNDKTQETLLHEAVKKNYWHIVDLLVCKGADLNARNNDGKVALDIALEQNYQDIADRLRREGLTIQPQTLQ